MNSNNVTVAGKTILLIHAGSMRKKFIFDRLKELGIQIVCLNKERTTLAEPYVSHWITADLKDYQACLDQVKQFMSDNPTVKIDGALTFWDECILLTSKIVDAFGWVGIPFAVSDRIKNKYVFRDACQTEGISAPCHVLIHQETDLDQVDKKLEYPLVIKPIYGACSAFVVRVENQAELQAAYATIKKNINNFWLAPEWKNLEVQAEEYIDGQEVDIDILLQDGQCTYIAIIDNKETNEPYFVETGWSSPSRLSAPEQRALEAMALSTLDKLGVKNGCVHFEAKIGSQGAVPIEVNLRMGGGEVYIYSKLVWGVDLVEGAATIALGLPLHVAKAASPHYHLLSHRFLSGDTCQVTKINVHKDLYTQDYFVDLYFEKQAGDIFLAPPEGYDRSIGVITVKGQSHQETANNLAKALKYIDYTLKKMETKQQD